MIGRVSGCEYEESDSIHRQIRTRGPESWREAKKEKKRIVCLMMGSRRDLLINEDVLYVLTRRSLGGGKVEARRRAMSWRTKANEAPRRGAASTMLLQAHSAVSHSVSHCCHSLCCSSLSLVLVTMKSKELKTKIYSHADSLILTLLALTLLSLSMLSLTLLTVLSLTVLSLTLT